MTSPALKTKHATQIFSSTHSRQIANHGPISYGWFVPKQRGDRLLDVLVLDSRHAIPCCWKRRGRAGGSHIHVLVFFLLVFVASISSCFDYLYTFQDIFMGIYSLINPCLQRYVNRRQPMMFNVFQAIERSPGWKGSSL